MKPISENVLLTLQKASNFLIKECGLYVLPVDIVNKSILGEMQLFAKPFPSFEEHGLKAIFEFSLILGGIRGGFDTFKSLATFKNFQLVSINQKTKYELMLETTANLSTCDYLYIIENDHIYEVTPHIAVAHHIMEIERILPNPYKSAISYNDNFSFVLKDYPENTQNCLRRSDGSTISEITEIALGLSTFDIDFNNVYVRTKDIVDFLKSHNINILGKKKEFTNCSTKFLNRVNSDSWTENLFQEDIFEKLILSTFYLSGVSEIVAIPHSLKLAIESFAYAEKEHSNLQKQSKEGRTTELGKKQHTFKDTIKTYLKINYPNLKDNEIENIAVVANIDKRKGKTESKI